MSPETFGMHRITLRTLDLIGFKDNKEPVDHVFNRGWKVEHIKGCGNEKVNRFHANIQNLLKIVLQDTLTRPFLFPARGAADAQSDVHLM